MTEYVSERAAGQIIGDSIGIYARNFPVIILIYLVPILPIILLSATAAASRDEALNIIAGVLHSVVAIFTTGAVTIAVSDVCVGNRPSFARSYAAIVQVFWRYLGTYALAMLVVFIGMLLLVIPGIYAAVLLMFALPVCIIERRAAVDAFKRSKTLGKGHYLRNFGVLVLGSLLMLLAAFVLGAVLGFILAKAGAGPFLFNFLPMLAGSAVAPIIMVVVILLYYDMRARKENFDGTALAQELMT